MVKPILFNTEMVRAILAGGKTVTRRLMKKPVIERDRNNDLCYLYETENDDGCFCIASWKYILPEIMQYSPYQPGDILYARETWREYNDKYYYKADECPDYDGYFTKKLPCAPKWHPSIHMPKEAARIWLSCEEVEVEQLREITDNEARREGFSNKKDFLDTYYKFYPEINEETWVWVIEFKRTVKPDENNG